MNKPQTPPLVAVLVPCFNEGLVIEDTANKLLDLLNNLIAKQKIAYSSFVCFIDDGSTDNTWNIILRLNQTNPFIKAIKLSRNFGQQSALLCGLLNTKDQADCVISIDADLQDDPSIIENFLEQFNNGYDIVYGVRKNRDSDSFFKKHSASLFYKVVRCFNKNIITNHADCRLLSKKVLNHLANFKEINLFLRGIIPSIGYNSTTVYYDRQQRIAGTSKYPLRRMVNLALDALASCSIQPLRLITLLGLLLVIPSLIIGLYLLIASLFKQQMFSSWEYIIVTIYFIGGIQLLSLGLVSEYVGKIYSETQSRPRYIIESEML